MSFKIHWLFCLLILTGELLAADQKPILNAKKLDFSVLQGEDRKKAESGDKRTICEKFCTPERCKDFYTSGYCVTICDRVKRKSKRSLGHRIRCHKMHEEKKARASS